MSRKKRQEKKSHEKIKLGKNQRMKTSFIHGEIFYDSIKTNHNCVYNFPIDLEPNGIPFWYQINRKSVITIQNWNHLTH